ncbi:hypothetical protein OFO16_04660 [Vibrio natriegens]|uniref:hypothetical protein n=1 Tax=Vibrio natriegens TaxID=691 RepID=UPI0021E9590D|nr:hypothetical protein [Vibrio natriegens]UYI47973.1 hypothetical protein OFO16_04660 [Vibrio natriegens]
MFDSGHPLLPENKWEGSISPLTFFKGRLESGSVLAIGEAHWYADLFEQMTQVLLSEELDGAFTHLFVEFGNAKHQILLADYLSGGGVSDDELAAVWLDSIAFPAWMHPCYGEFFRRLKQANAQRNTPIKVVLTEPPFDWQELRHPSQLAQLNAERDQALVEGIEVIKRQNDKGMVVLVGARHILKRSPTFGSTRHHPFGVLAAQRFGVQYVSVWPHMLPTTLEQDSLELGIYSTQQRRFSQMNFADLVPNKPTVNPYAATPVDQLVDAYWYLGPQTRQLSAAGAEIPQMWKAQLKQRLPFVNQRQRVVIQKVIE